MADFFCESGAWWQTGMELHGGQPEFLAAGRSRPGCARCRLGGSGDLDDPLAESAAGLQGAVRGGDVSLAFVTALQLLSPRQRAAGHRVSAMTMFPADTLARFGLPRTAPA